MSAYLVKPLKPAELNQAIIIAMARHSDLIQLKQVNKKLQDEIKELESYGHFEDLYGVTGSVQKEVFVKTVKKFCNLHESIIDSYIY